ncbi:MAG: ATP-binding protein, partial [Paracoccaceae bacterium]
MTFHWLKRYMPRGIYGRAALILMLPVVTLQLVISVVFIQRHFEGVSRQMSRELARSLTVALQEGDALTEALSFDVQSYDGALPVADMRRWYDLSGIIVTSTLRDHLRGVQRVVLPDDRWVVIYLQNGADLQKITIARHRASASNPHQLLVHMAFFGALMTAVSYLYLRNQLRPITRLADAAAAFGRGRVVSYSPSGAVEVRAAGRAFLDMRARIERQIEQRTLMLSGVSHDMRTPLTRLRLGLSMLDHEDRSELERDVADLQRLLDDFLDFARGEAASGQPEQTDPHALAAKAVAEAQRDGCSVMLAPPSGTGLVALRPLSIHRALTNLIGNALRYGTHCEVSVVISKRALCLRVEDDGPGIPEAEREAAFRPFERLDPARNQDKGGGVGLGLSIALD